MKKELRGQVAIVTGGSRGIGRAVAEALVGQGVNVAITGRDEAHLAAARSQIERAGPGSVETLRADVRSFEEVERAIAATEARFGGLDIVVNNAGTGIFSDVATLTPQQWAQVIDTNLTGVYNVCHVAVPLLRNRGGGYIINISSLAGTNVVPGGTAYCASKAGLNAFSEVLNQEVRQDNIRVSYLMPGSVATGFGGGDEAKGAEWKMGADDIAAMVISLLEMDTRTLPSRVELRPAKPPKK